MQGMKESYNRGVTDEFVIPFVCTDSGGQALATIRDDDACICFTLGDRPARLRGHHWKQRAECQGRQRFAGCG